MPDRQGCKDIEEVIQNMSCRRSAVLQMEVVGPQRGCDKRAEE